MTPPPYWRDKSGPRSVAVATQYASFGPLYFAVANTHKNLNIQYPVYNIILINYEHINYNNDNIITMQTYVPASAR